MEIILRPRRAGKTTEIIRKAAETFSYIVCKDREESRRVVEQAEKMGLDIPFPITVDEFIGGQFFGKGIKGFYIDNAELILERLTRGVPLKSISITWDGKIERKEGGE